MSTPDYAAKGREVMPDCPKCGSNINVERSFYNFGSHYCKFAWDGYFTPEPTQPTTDFQAGLTAAQEQFSGIDATLAERGNRYGAFTGHAQITQGLKLAMQIAPKWAGLSDDKKEALEMIQHKIGRILNGDPNYHDSWHDISGYAKLVADTLL